MVQAHSLELVAEVCSIEEFWDSLDSTDATTAIRLLDSTDADVRKGALRILSVMLSPNIGDSETVEKRRALFVANQIRPRLISLIRTELQPDLQGQAAELLSRVLFGEKPKNKRSPALNAHRKRSQSPTTTGIIRTRSKTSPRPSDYDFADFIALLTQVGPVALQACEILVSVLSEHCGDSEARSMFRKQRGVERLVLLLFDLSDPQLSDADWSAKARKHAMQALNFVIPDEACQDCFVDCGGLECAAFLIASSDRTQQEMAASWLDTICQRGMREQYYVERLLSGARTSADLSRPSGFLVHTSKNRLELEACKGIPNSCSKVLKILAAEGWPMRDLAKVMHTLCYWCGQNCPTIEVLKRELQDDRDELTRREMSKNKAAHEMSLLALDLEREREIHTIETRIARAAASSATEG